jgi:TonB family protein
MNRSRIIFFFTVLGVVIGIARCNSRQQASRTIGVAPSETATPAQSTILVPPPKPSPAVATAAPTAQHPPADFKKAADKIAPAVIAVSVFDSSGKLLRTGTGFFVSDDGRFVTSRSIIQGGTNAVAKTSDGHIYNVLGFLADAVPADVAVLKAQTKESVPFVSPNKSAAIDSGKAIAVIEGPGNRPEQKITETSISATRTDPNSDWLELPSLPSEVLGAPVVNENGDVLGVVTLQRGPGTAMTVVRVSAALDPILAKIEARAKPAWQKESPEPPAAAGPLPKPNVPLAGQRPTGNSRLISSPRPQYPTGARYSNLPAKGTGRYHVRFGNKGEVKDVQVIQSTRNPALDSAAVDALRRWKAVPGQEWTADVPITFEP